uniref:Uncharacterized protein n=1 Tax=Chrysemys picta bellii TaxID=8478 RepID=A0A8C3IST0_CHRPI
MSWLPTLTCCYAEEPPGAEAPRRLLLQQRALGPGQDYAPSMLPVGMKMPSNKPNKLKILPKDFDQTKESTSWASMPQSPHGDPEHPIPRGSRNSGDASLRALLLEIEKKADKNLEIVTAFDGKIVALNTRMDVLEGRVTSLAQSAAQTDSSVEKQKVKTQQCTQLLESQARARTLRILGLPEKEEGRDLIAFLEKWLPTVLRLDAPGDPIVVERAYRETNRRQKPGADACRTVIAHLADLRSRERILEQARRLKNIMYRRKQILIFPDLSPIPQGKRRTWKWQSCSLQCTGLKYVDQVNQNKSHNPCRQPFPGGESQSKVAIPV